MTTLETMDPIQASISQDYKYGFSSDIESESIPKGLSEDVIRLISSKKNEPEWLLEWRLKAYRHWLTMEDPLWHNVKIAPDRLSGNHLLHRAQAQKSTEQSGRSRPGTAGNV